MASGQIIMARSRLMRLSLVLAFVSVVALLGWGTFHYWIRSLGPVRLPGPPIVMMREGQFVLRHPTSFLAAEIAAYADELTAYLHFEYLRSLAKVDESRAFLLSEETSGEPQYRIYLLVENNLLTAIPYLSRLKGERLITHFELQGWTARDLAYFTAQTKVFEAAYNLPVRLKLEAMGPEQLHSPMVRFLLFKSKTDPRIRERIEPAPKPLSRDQARELAADVIAIAQFYDLPLDFFLGIGAMENNYMDVRGDLLHSVWKRRAQKGDIVLKRRRGRVLVWNYSMGVWQITRETLRYAHSLYLRDKRDYSLLPERLRPPRALDFGAVNTGVLTTYAGLLFRELLDRFEGDVHKAVGAYNGGIRNPNPEYAEGVQIAAQHARRILEHAVTLNRQSEAETRLELTRQASVPAPDLKNE